MPAGNPMAYYSKSTKAPMGGKKKKKKAKK